MKISNYSQAHDQAFWYTGAKILGGKEWMLHLDLSFGWDISNHLVWPHQDSNLSPRHVRPNVDGSEEDLYLWLIIIPNLIPLKHGHIWRLHFDLSFGSDISHHLVWPHWDSNLSPRHVRLGRYPLHPCQGRQELSPYLTYCLILKSRSL